MDNEHTRCVRQGRQSVGAQAVRVPAPMAKTIDGVAFACGDISVPVPSYRKVETGFFFLVLFCFLFVCFFFWGGGGFGFGFR